MAQIDVSDLLADPDFVDRVILIRRKSTVSDKGQNTLTEEQIPTWASVHPIDGKTLQRIPEAYRVANVKSFFIKATLLADGSCKYPDIISHKGIRYQVQVVFDWTNFGQGWSEGTCVQEKPAR